MRRFLSAFTVLLCLGSQQALPADDPLAEPVSRTRILEKPGAFETLVNPNCSHCIDEARRRRDQLKPTDPVLAWTRGTYEGGAIPVRFFLAPYRVISDTYGVFVYDPDAGFMRGFEPSLDFQFHGWRKGIVVIRHKDGTLYSALTGKAFAGPRQGEQLKPVPTIESQWGDWLARYPGTVAYHMFEKYQPVELPRDENADSVSTRAEADPRLPASSVVLGVEIDGTARCYPLEVLEESEGVIADTIAGQQVYVLWYKPTGTAAIYAAETDETQKPTRAVTLTADSHSTSAPFMDRETGSHWDIAGRAISGELTGRTLRWLPGVQCKWFAWAAEYPETEVYDAPNAEPESKKPNQVSDGAAADVNQPTANEQQSQAPALPLEGVIVEAADVTPDQAAAWAESGQKIVAVLLDERTSAEAYQDVAHTVSAAQLTLYYWIEVARNEAMADAHPRWMASLGMHDDWQTRFPDTRRPLKDKEVAKAYPWVPIGYQEAFNAHLERISQLRARMAEPYHGLLLNDLQGGPAACGCGNLQCRWALDYGVPATATKLEGDDVAVRFLTAVQELVVEKEVVPIWVTECEHDDLAANHRNGTAGTGLCGRVPCAIGTCPEVFARQWAPLVENRNSAIGLLVLQQELERTGLLYMNASWIPKAVEYIDTIPARNGSQPLPHDRLWLIIQGVGLSADEQAASRAAALKVDSSAVLTALTRIDQSYEPRIVPAR